MISILKGQWNEMKDSFNYNFNLKTPYNYNRDSKKILIYDDDYD